MSLKVQFLIPYERRPSLQPSIYSTPPPNSNTPSMRQVDPTPPSTLGTPSHGSSTRTTTSRLAADSGSGTRSSTHSSQIWRRQ